MSPLWRDSRFWRWVAQVGAIAVLVAIALLLWSNFNRNLQQLGLQFGFDFLQSQAAFRIGETPIAFSAADTYQRALLVGLLNTFRIMVSGIILTTIVGIIVGIARLSDNWLVRNLALVYVEALRNTPLLLHLLFWYFAVFLQLPNSETPLIVWGLLEVSKNGINLPGGVRLSSEFSALLAGLTFYTATFIAEIVRGGIQSVHRGQWEAAKALGLKPGQVLRFVIFPQALRAIVPSLTNQYLNLAKNSALAVAIGYPDLYSVSATTFNQTGRAVEVILLIMVTYLSISLVIALGMSVVNRQVQLVER